MRLQKRIAAFREFWSPATRAYLIAGYATYLAVALALLPPLIDSRLRNVRDYDPTLAVLTATLIALIWTAYHTFQGVQHDRAITQRQSASRKQEVEFFLEALAEEMRILDWTLGLVEKVPKLARLELLGHPILSECLRRSDLFPPRLAAPMTGVVGTLRPLRPILAAIPPNAKDPIFHKMEAQVIESARQSVKVLAQRLLEVVEERHKAAVEIETR